MDSGRMFCGIIFSIFLIYSIKEIFVETSAEKEIPVTKVGLSSKIGPTLKFYYCYSCGYRKAFDEYSAILHKKYPEISIEGGNYEPPGYSMFVAKFVGLGKLLVIVCILSGINLFRYFGQEAPPSWWVWCVENKLYACLMIFFLSNALEGHLVSTGAFEISLNDMPVWSKLETGRIPQPPELFQIIDNHMQFDDTIELKPGFAK
ncbi:thioredoxin reductase-like selenoprotein T homolog CG3887 [Macrosteles quadrilineatus]|uniref:thioredoxin reductase-like selenoprotein T homolog CG3887 n=1 Tax=Macrosteles quadrilineatus TaxID=74068 RepID=UPI0023E12338|nr:thioredoxin reductase-like selenoprotein T homolog CG3887 [Macrosteles quadrilineatus]